MLWTPSPNGSSRAVDADRPLAESRESMTLGRQAVSFLRSGGTVVGGCRRGGSSDKRSVVASVMRRTAASKALSVVGEVDWTPETFRTYWRAADSISSAVALGCRPLRVVMFRHIGEGYASTTECEMSGPVRALGGSSPAFIIQAKRSAGMAAQHSLTFPTVGTTERPLLANETAVHSVLQARKRHGYWVCALSALRTGRHRSCRQQGMAPNAR
jgi:hypothetical protein